MPDTRRTQATLMATIFQDGQVAGSLSPQDMRDFLLSATRTTSAVAPTAANDLTQGYDVGSSWIQTTATPHYWICVDNTSAAARWAEVTIA